VPATIHFVSYEPAIGPLVQLEVDGRSPDWVIIGGDRPFAHSWNKRIY